MDWEDLLDIEKKKILDSPFREIPVGFKEFVESKDFCGHDSLSPVQYHEVERGIGKDPTKIFTSDRTARLLVWLWGKGAGKGTTSSLLGLYLFYVLLCMRDSHSYFNVAHADPLSFVNVALSGRQAERFFERFSNRLKENNWFRQYRIVDRGKVIKGTGSEKNKGLSIEMTGSLIEFPQNLHAVSLHSQNEKWEDLTLFGFVCDEISGFRTEKGIYNGEAILKTLVFSTRELPYLGVVTSFPRLDEDTDLCYKKYKEAVDEEKEKGEKSRAKGSRYFTWQVKPKRFYSGNTFKFVISERTGETIDVPIEYEHEATTEPETFKQKKMCILSGAIGDFFQYPSFLNRIPRREPILHTIDELVDVGDVTRVRKKIISLITDKQTPRWILLDAGRSNSEASLTVAHREDKVTENNIRIVRCVADAIIVWTPNEKKGIIVDIDNYQAIVEQLGNHLNIVGVRMDHWNAAAIEAHLSTVGFSCEILNATYEAYTRMRSAIYGSGFIIANQIEDSFDNDGNVVQINRADQFTKQCKLLKARGMQKPKVVMGRQDLTDTIAHACDVLLRDITQGVWDDDVIGVSVRFPMDGQQFLAEQQRGEIEQAFGFKRTIKNPVRDTDDNVDDLAVII